MVDTKFQTSFIPKQPVTEEPKRSGGSSIAFLITFLIFIASAAGAVGVAIWNKTILTQIEKGQQQLEAHRNAFDSKSITEFTRLDNRIDIASELLRSHVGASAIFSKLAENTLKTVRFSNFSYSHGGGDKILITMSGESLDYESMALQAQQLTKPALQNAFRSPIFSNFSRARDIVVFSFTSGIDPYIVDYYNARRAGATGTQTMPADGAPNQMTQ